MTESESGLRAKANALNRLTDELQAQLRVLSESTAPVRVTVVSSPTPVGERDIEAIAFVVLMEASRSAQEDLKAVMAKVRAITKSTEASRQRRPDNRRSDLDFESIVHLVANLYAKQLEAELREIQHDIESTTEVAEMQQLRLQMVMDRMSKMMTTLSNVLKKVADTTETITQNLK